MGEVSQFFQILRCGFSASIFFALFFLPFSVSSGPSGFSRGDACSGHARMYIYGCHDLSSTSLLLSFVPVARYHTCTMRYYSRNRHYYPSSAFAAADAGASAHRQRACSRAPEISAQHGASKVQRGERQVGDAVRYRPRQVQLRNRRGMCMYSASVNARVVRVIRCRGCAKRGREDPRRSERTEGVVESDLRVVCQDVERGVSGW